MKFKNIRDGFLYALIIVSVILLIVSQIYVGIKRSKESEDAVLFTCKNSISFTGVIVRDEKLIYSNVIDKGVIDYTVDDGSRLSKDSVIANIYDGVDQIYSRYRIEKLEENIEMLTRAQDHGTTDYAQPEFITSQINESYKEILLNIASKNFKSVYETGNDMLKLMCIYNIATNAETDFSQRIADLNTELSIFNASLKKPLDTIEADETGYFTSHYDGYENVLSTENITSLTADEIKNIIKDTSANPIIDGVIGKVFNDYTWKMVGVIDTDDIFFVNEKITLSFSSLNERHTAVVDSITPTGNGNEAIIILTCEELNSEIAGLRTADVELIFDEHTGIKASRSAIRFVDGVKGVYVLEGESLHFKKLDVIYEGDDYVLSKNTSDNDYLNLYDKIILEPIETKPVQE